MFGIWFLGYGLLDPFGMATVLFFGRVVVGNEWNGCVCGEVGDSFECLNGSNGLVVLWNAAVVVVMVEKTVTLLGSSENASVSDFCGYRDVKQHQIDHKKVHIQCLNRY